jgi:hydroxymethylglutaryl-CoA synthase
MLRRNMRIGIDGMGLALPGGYVSLSDLARARKVPTEKYTQGLGTLAMGVPLPAEDTVSLAVRSAKDAFERFNVSPKEIGLCIVGTETAVDHAKPVASFVQGLLDLPRDCRVFETKHACYGGTAGLMTALDWIAAGRAQGRKALVVCADIARYGLGSPGEPTQGAGAVALLVSDAPRVLTVDTDTVGTASNDVLDFWRPLDAKEARVDGQYSVTCYLDALTRAFEAHRARARRVMSPVGDHEARSAYTNRFRAMLYHVPYAKLARKGHELLRRLDGDLPLEEARMLGPGLTIPQVVGNTYTASLYLSLMSLLASAPDSLDGEKIALYSYGSGSCAEFFTGDITPGAQAFFDDVLPSLDARTRLSVKEYEAILAERDELDHELAPEPTAAGIWPRFVGTNEGRRVYS